VAFVDQGTQARFGIERHRPKLVDAELLPALPDPCLPEERRALGVKTDRESDQQQERHGHESEQRCQGKVLTALDEES